MKASSDLVTIDVRNDEFQRLEALKHNRRQRNAQRRFLVEGVRSIDQLCDRDWPVEGFLFVDRGELSRWAQGILDRSPGARHYRLSAELMRALSDKDETSELLAIASMRALERTAIAPREPALIVVLDRPSNPGNLGTLIRSCDGLGVDGVALFGHRADPYDPRAIRAAAGSMFALPVVPIESTAAMKTWLAEIRDQIPGLSIVGSSAAAPLACYDHAFSNPTVLMIGNERSGLSDSLSQLCEVIVSVPMTGSASSLNVASAASILLYEVARQRIAGAARS